MRKRLFRYRGLALAIPAVILLACARPTGLTLAVGAIFSLLGEGLRLWAIGYSGEPTRSQDLTAPVLITAGPYSLVRNPLYLGNLLTIVGVAAAALATRSWLAPLGAACIAGAAYASIISLEEEFLLARFGAQYVDYRQQVPALWPRRWRPGPGQGRFSRRGWKYEVSSLIWLGLVWLVLLAQRGNLVSRKKRARKQDTPGTVLVTPAASKAAAPKAPPDPRLARRLAVIGIGLIGVLMGLLTGVNHIPQAPATLTDPAARAIFEGAVLGLQPLDWVQGVQLAVCGGIFGFSAGISLLLEPARTMGAWLLGSLGLAAGLGLGVLPGAMGWLLGFGAAIKAIPLAKPVTNGVQPVTGP